MVDPGCYTTVLHWPFVGMFPVLGGGGGASRVSPPKSASECANNTLNIGDCSWLGVGVVLYKCFRRFG